jgi:cell division protein FtsN
MKAQRGGFVLGLIVGLLVGLGLSLAVALYVTKVPVPFVDKVSRPPHNDAAEAERLKRWDPNGPLSGRPAQRGESASTPAVPPPVSPPPPPPAQANRPAAPGAAAAPPAAAVPAPTPAAAAPSADPFRYFVQVGAYSRADDAEQQRARLAMLGFTARVSEREQAGRTVYRVRLGPFERKDEADAVQERLKSNAVESALVRVER